MQNVIRAIVPERELQKQSGTRMRHLPTVETFVREIVRQKMVKLLKIKGSENPADILTKHVTKKTLESLWYHYGWQPLDVEFPVKKDLKRINEISDIVTGEAIMKQYSRKLRKVTINKADSLRKEFDKVMEKSHMEIDY